MKNKDLERGYNELVAGKKTNRLAMILITVFCIVITLGAIISSTISSMAMADKVKVVDTRGVQMKSNLKRQSELVKIGIQSHVEDALFYMNSFQRETLDTNRKRALMLIDKESAYRVFETYKKEGIYDDAVERGHIYKVEKTAVTHLTEEGEPYKFMAQSELVTIDGSKREYFTIISEGYVTFRTPSYPYNTHGLWITEFRQKATKIVTDE